MPLRSRKPTSPGRRFQTRLRLLRDHPRPPGALARRAAARAPAAATTYGRKTARHRGGGHKHQYRLVDFRRDKDGVPAKVAAIEYDPNRNARIALLHYADGEKRYILAPAQVQVGDRLQSGQGAEIRPGNALPMRYIPVGSVIHNVELRPGGGGKMARGAGMSVQLVAKEGDFATLRLPSTEMRRVSIDCRATLGRRRQRRGRADQDRQGRPQPLEGRPPPDPRRRHEPGRPPARWRRGQVLGWPAPGVARGASPRAAPGPATRSPTR